MPLSVAIVMMLAPMQSAAPLGGSLPDAVQAERLARCRAQVAIDAAAGLADAAAFAAEGGGRWAQRCRAEALAGQGDYRGAAELYADLARTTDSAAGGRASTARDAAALWGQAGNAALAGGDAARAIAHLDIAIQRASGPALLGDQALGLLHLDRARAAAMTGDWARATADLAQARRLVPQDPLVWLLTATLDRREGRLAEAKGALATAVRLAPGDPAIALEAGNIAWAAGDQAGARSGWEGAVRLGRDSAAGRTAAERLKALAEPAPQSR